MPVEKKFILIIGYLWVCRFFFKFDLISYNHPQITSANSGHSRTEFLLTKLLFSIYDRIIFYTETARDKAITENLLSARKAFFANNTLDTQSIWSLSTNRFRDETPPSILFIGRLVEYKGPELLLKYFEHIISRVPDCRLIIVGDGPLRDVIATAAENCERITWLGELTSEREISLYMDNSDIVFIPGASGLSIVHAFCYGKPYVTTSGTFRHGPELSYLMHEMNGLLLGSDFEKNVDEIIRLLSDREKRQRMSKEAYDMATKLRAENWCVQMVLGLRGLEQTRRLLVVD